MTAGPPEGGHGRAMLWILVAALLWRWAIAMRTPVPSEDGANYLWMAQQFAAGDFTTPVGEVFPPLLPLLVALPVALGIEPFLAGQLVCCVGGTLAILPIARATELIQPGAGPWAGCLVATAALPVRVCAEVQTESLFFLFAGLAVWSGLSRKGWQLGLWTGVAFWLRPEALVLPLAFLLGGGARGGQGRWAWRSLLPAAGLVVGLVLWRGLAGHGFDPLPKLTFHLGRDDLAGRGDVLDNLAQVPWQLVEAFGPVILLAVWGCARRRSPLLAPLYWTVGLGIAVICTFVARRRFLVAWTPAVVPLAAVGLSELPRRARQPVLALAVLFGAVVSWRGVTDPNRQAERLVGEYLAGSLAPGEDVAGDMTRVIWFAGRRPLPPRHFSVEQLVERARVPGVRYVVLRSRQPENERVVEALAGKFATLVLPPGLQGPARERGITVLVRR